MLLTGLDWKYFNWHQLEFHGKLNLLKSGMVFADAIVTVSPRYAQEIQSAPLGSGLEGVLQNRREVLSGILNGIDENEWNPATDRHLAERYNVSTFSRGKAACKAALQKELGLPQMPGVPLVASISRLDEQKGIDLIAEVVQRWVQTSDVQWVILGTGAPKFQKQFESLAARFPEKVSARMEFSNALAHRIEAGADIFLMPSKYEPCGLNQMYSLKYGTIPIVRETGGLADTIIGYGGVQAESSPANGFSFQEYSALALSETLRRACDLFRLHPEQWKQLVETGMGQDWSWGRSARKYVELYERSLVKRTSVAGTAPTER
jgi:starch synthase